MVDITAVNLSKNEWEHLDHELRDEYFQASDNENDRIELFGENHQFLGSLELRDGFIELRDENWETVARILDGAGMSVEDIEAEYAGFQDAWDALKDYLPDVDESSAKFSIDNWDNIVIFGDDGAMIGRVSSWDYEDSWYRLEDGVQYTITHTGSGFDFRDSDWNNIGRYETSDRDYTHQGETELSEPIDDETSVFTSYSLRADDASMKHFGHAHDNYYLPRLSEDAVATVEDALRHDLGQCS